MAADLDNLVDPTDLADDDIRSVNDEGLRKVLYRFSESIKRVLQSQQASIISVNDAVEKLEEEP